MKKNHRKITENLGIIKCQYDEKEYFVVYFNPMPNLPQGELGMCIGKGKKIEEALENALINIINIEVKTQKSLVFAKNYLSNSSFYNQITELDVCKLPLPENIYDQESECYTLKDSEKMGNAEVFLNKDGYGTLGFS